MIRNRKKMFLVLGSIIAIVCLCLCFRLFNKRSVDLDLKIIEGNSFQNDVIAMLCYNSGHSDMSKSKTFLVSNDYIKESDFKYYLGVAHVFPDEIISKNFAVPFGFNSGSEMSDKMGQIIDYRKYKDLEVLVLNDWRTEDKKFIIAFNKLGDISKIEFPVTGEAYLGMHRDQNYIYILINLEEKLLCSQIDITDNSYSIEEISYNGLVRDRKDLLESNVIIKNNRIFLGETSYKNGAINSTVSSYNLITKEKKQVDCKDRWIYNLLYNNGELIVLCGKNPDAQGYFKNIEYLSVDENLNERKRNNIDGLPVDIDVTNMRDRSILYNHKLYSILNGIKIGINYLLVYDLESEQIEYLASIENADNEKTLLDWEFLIMENENIHSIIK